MPVTVCATNMTSDAMDSAVGSLSLSASQLMMVPIVASSMPVKMASLSRPSEWVNACTF